MTRNVGLLSTAGQKYAVYSVQTFFLKDIENGLEGMCPGRP